MRTLVVSDLHLGTRAGVDVLRRAPVLDAFADALADVDRLEAVRPPERAAVGEVELVT